MASNKLLRSNRRGKPASCALTPVWKHATRKRRDVIKVAEQRGGSTVPCRVPRDLFTKVVSWLRTTKHDCAPTRLCRGNSMIFSDDRLRQRHCSTLLARSARQPGRDSMRSKSIAARVNLRTIERSPPPRDWTPRSSRQPEDRLRGTGPFELSLGRPAASP
jgi:hypothetical protein